MHFYRGQIYMSLYEYSAQQAMASGNVDQTLLEGYKSKAAESFIFCLNEPKKKFKDDVTGMADMKFTMMFDGGVKMYNDKKYEQALVMFFQAYEIKSMLNMDYGDSKKNGIISMNQIVDKLITAEKPDFNTAIALVEQVRTQFPKDIDLLISLINIHLKNNFQCATYPPIFFYRKGFHTFLCSYFFKDSYFLYLVYFIKINLFHPLMLVSLFFESILVIIQYHATNLFYLPF